MDRRMNPPTTHLRPAGSTVALCGALGFGWTYALVRVTCQDCLAAALDGPAPGDLPPP